MAIIIEILFPSIPPNPRHRLIIPKQHRSRTPIPILRNQQFPPTLGRVPLQIFRQPLGIARSLRNHILSVLVPMLGLHFGQLQVVNDDQIT